MVRPVALSLVFLLATPAVAEEPLRAAVDLAQGQPAPYAGTLSDSRAWQVAAAKRLEAEQARDAWKAKAEACSNAGPSLMTALAILGGIFLAGAVVGVVVTK